MKALVGMHGFKYYSPSIVKFRQSPVDSSKHSTTPCCQIVLCTSTRPDFNAEEVASVAKDQKELFIIVEDMADHLPIEDPSKGAYSQCVVNSAANDPLVTERWRRPLLGHSPG